MVLYGMPSFTDSRMSLTNEKRKEDVTGYDPLELVRSLIEAEADPTSLAGSSYRRASSSLASALDSCESYISTDNVLYHVRPHIISRKGVCYVQLTRPRV